VAPPTRRERTSIDGATFASASWNTLRSRALHLLLDGIERAIDDLLGGGLLALVHDVVHELGETRSP
jgi:hypothetical protein